MNLKTHQKAPSCRKPGWGTKKNIPKAQRPRVKKKQNKTPKKNRRVWAVLGLHFSQLTHQHPPAFASGRTWELVGVPPPDSGCLGMFPGCWKKDSVFVVGFRGVFSVIVSFLFWLYQFWPFFGFPFWLYLLVYWCYKCVFACLRLLWYEKPLNLPLRTHILRVVC